MPIRLATKTDIPALQRLLAQILAVHHMARPDLFQDKGSKYSDEALQELIDKEETAIFVYVTEEGEVIGHLFVTLEENTAPLTPHKTLFIDDLCVDEQARGQRIGEQLYQFALDYAKEQGCYNLTLDVWNDNKGAVKFYERLGMTPRKTVMEQRL